MSKHNATALSTLVLLIGLHVGPLASADITNVTAVADAYIVSNDGDTNFSNSPTTGLMMRSHSAVTRATVVQFTLPVAGKQVVDQIVLTLAGRSPSDVRFPDVEVLATTTAIDLATVTWNNAVSSSLITGRDTDYTVLWNPAVWTDTAQTWDIDAMTYDSTISYTDATAADGLLKFVNDHYNGTSAVTFTIGLALAGNEVVSGSGGASFRSLEETSYAPPTLSLTFTAIPEPASLGLLALGVLAIGSRRRRG